MAKRHGLGFGNGTIVEHEDVTAGYIPSAGFTQAFRVRIADVTGFSVTSGKKVLTRTFNVMGVGTHLGSATVNHDAAEKIEEWFRGHPDFGVNTVSSVARAEPATTAPGNLIADELRKLAELHKEGVLTDEEFATQKLRLLSS
jgi:hypothetical protein